MITNDPNRPLNPATTNEVAENLPKPAATVATGIGAVSDQGAGRTGEIPSGPTSGNVAAPALLRLAQLTTSGPSPFELNPENAAGAVSLPAALQGLAAGPQRDALIQTLAGALKAQRGIEIPADVLAKIQLNPVLLCNLLVVDSKELEFGTDAIEAAFQAGKMKDIAPMPTDLPNGFDLANIKDAPLTLPTEGPKEIVPGAGIYTGDLIGALVTEDPARAKQNMALAQVIDRLAKNGSAVADGTFSVKLGDRNIDSLNGLIDELKARGYQIEATIDHRTANFIDLKTKDADGNFHDVAAPMMLANALSSRGKGTIEPVTHSELVIHIKSGPNSGEPKLDADVKFYQGVSGTGFFPVGMTQNAGWCGGATSETLSGDQAWLAVERAGLDSNLINTAAITEKLYAGGYGKLGVCNDTVAEVQYSVTGHASPRPLLKRNSALLGAVRVLTSNPDPRIAADAKALERADLALQNDLEPPAGKEARKKWMIDGARRAEISNPWPAGKSPFRVVEQNRVIYREILGR